MHYYFKTFDIKLLRDKQDLFEILRILRADENTICNIRNGKNRLLWMIKKMKEVISIKNHYAE